MTVQGGQQGQWMNNGLAMASIESQAYPQSNRSVGHSRGVLIHPPPPHPLDVLRSTGHSKSIGSANMNGSAKDYDGFKPCPQFSRENYYCRMMILTPSPHD